MALVDIFKKIEPDKEKSPFLHTAYDAFFTFAFTPNQTTSGTGVHIRDGIDLKRTMVHVVLALQLCYIFGTYNIGHQHFVALGIHTGFVEAIHLKLAYGLIQLLPIFVVTHLVGLGIEFYYAAKKGHAVEEGFLVSGALIPLIMPPDIPLWILALSVAFAVWIGKEAFGGTGMNILNIALLARVFIFFAYPTTISGDDVWVATFLDDAANDQGVIKAAAGSVADYGWWHTGFFNGLFEWMGLDTFREGAIVVDGYTGATPLGIAAKGSWADVTAVYSPSQMWWGNIPGSIGEMCKPAILIGAAFMIFTGVASWRIMLGGLIGCVTMGLILNAWGATEFMLIPWYYQIIMGSFLFAIVFMATDPVSAASTKRGKWIYGFLIGFVGLIIRVLNPAYPEGWMLAILFMNVFAPLIDYYVLQANVARREKRLAAIQVPATVQVPAANQEVI